MNKKWHVLLLVGVMLVPAIEVRSQPTPRLPNAKSDAEQLCEAAGRNDANEVNALLGRGVPVDAADEDGATPLMYAAVRGHTQIAELLLAKGAKVNAQSKGGYTALIQATWGSGDQMVPLLLKAGADPNLADADGDTALRYAAERKKDAIEPLLEAGAKMAMIEYEGAIAKWRSDGEKEYRVAALLLKAKWKEEGGNDSPERTKSIALLDAALSGDAARIESLIAGPPADAEATVIAVQLLRRSGSPVSREIFGRNLAAQRQLSAINKATEDFNKAKTVEEARALLDKGARINRIENGMRRTLVCHAAAEGRVEILKLLIERGGEVNVICSSGGSEQSTPLILAIQNGHIEAARLLVEKGAKTDVIKRFPVMHTAGRLGNIEGIRMFLELGADINDASAFEGHTCLMDAAEAGKLDTVKFLLSKGAKTELKTTSSVTRPGGFTALNLAEGNFRDPVVKLLRSPKKPASTQPSPEPSNPLLVPATYTDTKKVAEALDTGASPNDTGEYGTPLYLALNARRDAAKLLIERGAKLEAGPGETPPLFFAVAHVASGDKPSEEEYLSFLGFLLDHGADINAVDPYRGRTALMVAVTRGSISTVRTLLGRGANVNIRTKEGRTALSYSNRYDENPINKMLKSAGAQE